MTNPKNRGHGGWLGECSLYNGPGPRLGPKGFTRVFEILTCIHFFRSKCGLANMHAFFSVGLRVMHACIFLIEKKSPVDGSSNSLASRHDGKL